MRTLSEIVLEMRGITKEFPGVKALDNVNLKVRSGEIHALVGENGAGKSTLMKVLSGVYPYGQYEGEIWFEQELCRFKDIRQSEERGIVIIHQELALSPYLSIAENIFLGHERARRKIIDWKQTYAEAQKLMERVGLDESPRTLVMNLGVGKQQLVEIAKALSKNVKLLILDEPTAALNEDDSQNLLRLLVELKKQGITSILISHKLNEIKSVADTITILRDGRTIETLDAAKDDVSEDRIIKGMVGRELTHRFPPRQAQIGDIRFEVRDWVVYHPQQPDRIVIDRVNLYVRRGEIVGIAGLMGSGRTELAMSLFGKSYGRNISGKILKDGKEIQVNNVQQAIRHGLAYVSEDRKTYGLNLIDNVVRNISMASLHNLSKRTVLDRKRESEEAERLRKAMKIKTPSLNQIVANLSGGNQQKVVLSKWVLTEPDVLILDEPTRGIDVGAKYEIYTIIHELAAAGKAIIVISSELQEVIGLSDRIYTMCEGRISGEVSGDELTSEGAEELQEKLMRLMTDTGGRNGANAS